MKISKKLMIGLIVSLSLSACQSTKTPSAPTGDTSYYMGRWESARDLHSDQPAPTWTVKEYAELLKAYENCKADSKEVKVK